MQFHVNKVKWKFKIQQDLFACWKGYVWVTFRQHISSKSNPSQQWLIFFPITIKANMLTETCGFHRVVFDDALTETLFFFLPLEMCYCNSLIACFEKQLTWLVVYTIKCSYQFVWIWLWFWSVSVVFGFLWVEDMLGSLLVKLILDKRVCELNDFYAK